MPQLREKHARRQLQVECPEQSPLRSLLTGVKHVAQEGVGAGAAHPCVWHPTLEVGLPRDCRTKVLGRPPKRLLSFQWRVGEAHP